jgi:hypothetical protein
MENLQLNTDELITKNISFFDFVLKFDNDTKNELLNTFQYSILAFIPLLLLTKGISSIFPGADETKSSMLIISEIFGQLFSMYLGLFIINRIIKFIPTFSKVKYIGSFKVVNIILPTLFMTLTFNTKIQNKADLLYNRIMVFIYGEKYNDSLDTQTQEGMHNQNVNVGHGYTNLPPIQYDNEDMKPQPPVPQIMHQPTNATPLPSLPQQPLPQQQLPSQPQQQHSIDNQQLNSEQDSSFGMCNEPEAFGGSNSGGFSSW